MLPDSPAAESGLNSGDMILKINANAIYDWSEIKKFVNEKEVKLSLLQLIGMEKVNNYL